MPLIIPRKPVPSTRLGEWMYQPQYLPIQQQIVLRALQDGNQHERPLGSNRSPYLDALADWARIPRGQYWCALWGGAVLAACGLLVPQDFANCDTWLPYIVDVKSLPAEKRVGCVILYGKRGSGAVISDWQSMKALGWDAVHFGIVTNWLRDPYDLVISTEGNRGYQGLPIGTPNNGIAIDTAPVTRKDIIGLVPWTKLQAAA